MLKLNIIKKIFFIVIPLIFFVTISSHIFAARQFLDYFFQVPFFLFFAVFFIFFLNFFLTSTRLMLAYRQFGYAVPFRNIFKAGIMGQISGYFMIPFFSAMVGQHYSLKNFGIPRAVTAIVALYERVLMGIIASCLSLCSVFLIWPHLVSKVMMYCFQFIEICAVILCIFCVLVFRGWSLKEKKFFSLFLSKRSFIYGSGIVFFSFLSFFLVANSFMVLLFFFNQSFSYKIILGSCLIVSFISSLPISFNGWGVREFASVTVFKTLGVPIEESLFISIFIGAVSLFSLIILSLLSKYVLKESKYTSQLIVEIPLFKGLNLEKFLIAFLTYSASIGLFFQLHFSIPPIMINISPTDLIALCGLLIFFDEFYHDRIRYTVPYMKTFFICLPVVFSVSLLNGIFHFGFTSWAFYNKFLGLFVLLGYAGLGIVFVKNFGKQGVYRIIDIMGITLFFIVLFKFLFVPFFMEFGILNARSGEGFQGYAGNRNAFAIQLLSVFCLLCYRSKYCFNVSKSFISMQNFLSGVILMGIYYTYSRGCIIATLCFIAMFMFFKIMTLKNLFHLFFSALFLPAIFYLLNGALIFFNLIVAYFSSLPFSWLPSYLLSVYSFQYSDEQSNQERVYTLIEGVKLWLSYPLFGAGLGRFVFNELEKKHRYLTIHHTFLWFLAEFGVLGTFPVCFYGYQIMKEIKTHIKYFFKFKYNIPFENFLHLILLVIICLLGQIYEIFYQRILWLIFGFSLTTLRLSFGTNDSKK
ncbi:O-antigen ligase family protein [Holospora obtusa]|uniref:O-antigen ligase family protein n=1 Tax=Holospora obtusa TaxID=49893 RepID=UPI0003F7EF42|nr:lysylphosphatidylglycerol synthase domain-containing protein [Holospora obtusa]